MRHYGRRTRIGFKALRLKSSTHLIHPRDLPAGSIGIHSPSIEYGVLLLEIPKYSGADSLLRLIQFLLQYHAKRVSPTEL